MKEGVIMLLAMSLSSNVCGIPAQMSQLMITESQPADHILNTLSPQEQEFIENHLKITKEIITSSQQEAEERSCKSKIINLKEPLPIISQGCGGEQNLLDKDHPNLAKGFFVFVSLSMQEANLIQLAKEAKQYGAILVLRGLKNNSFRQTATALKNIIEKAENGLLIDPTLFRQHHVTHVPTFVLETDVIAGNISLAYALERMSQEGDQKEHAAQLLKGRSSLESIQ